MTTELPAGARPQVIVLHPKDNVALAVVDLPAGTTIRTEQAGEQLTITLRDSIEFAHKFAIRPIGQGEPVIKYGQRIGRTTAPIEVGEHVHVHNVEAERARGDLAEPPPGATRQPGR